MATRIQASPDLEHRTTILLSADLHRRLGVLAARRKSSMGALIREAVEAYYGLCDEVDRLAALDELCALELPVGSPAEMKAESVSPWKELA